MKNTLLFILILLSKLSYSQISNITFYPGSQSGICNSISNSFTLANDIAFFCGHKSNGANRLFTSTGDIASTAELKDFEGKDIRNPKIFRTMGNLAFITATHPIFGTTLYRSDGTQSGTYPLYEGYIQSIIGLFVIGDKLYFDGTRTGGISDLCVTDGSIAGTFELTTNNGDFLDFPSHFIDFNGTTYFTAITPTTGRELFKTNGTISGTNLSKDLNPGSSDGVFGCKVFNNKLYLNADNGISGKELYSTSNGFVITLFKDINVK